MVFNYNENKKKYFFMYTKKEILAIFHSIATKQDLDNVLETFCWLIENEFEVKSQFLHAISTHAYRRVNKLGNYGN